MRASVAAIVLAAAVLSDARAGDENPDMDRSCDDLVCRFGPWDGCDGWLAANRAAILATSRRATPVAAGAARPEDAAARSRARDALVAALGSRDVLVASEAALALGRAGDARDISALARIVDAGRASRRMLRMAAVGLGELPMGDAAHADEARKALLGALSSGVGHQDLAACFWSNCAYALAMRGDGAAVPRLIELRGKAMGGHTAQTWTAPELTGSICYALGVLGREDALTELDQQLRSRRASTTFNGDANWSVVHALSRIGGTKALGLLRQAATDDREFVRCEALQALGAVVGSTDEESVKILRDAVASEDVALCRQMAALGFGRTGHPTAGPVLAAAMARASSVDRRYFALALGLWLRRSPDAKLAAQLTKALEKTGSQDERVALTIACGLGGVQAARAAIVETIPKNRGGPNAASAAFALGVLGGGPPELKLLREIVAQSPDPTARREAAIALGTLRDHEVVDQLRTIVKSRSPDMDRSSAAICLGIVGDDADIEFFVAMLSDKWTNDALRACLIRGLGRLLDREEGGRVARIVANGRWFWQAGIVDPFGDFRELSD